ncbi:hypothetical protein [Endozoicomonas sp. ONNA2]|uniref:hypothetical protein n=1 Tax=Endozoicomonas sp. ONNA2 TaxID=2828741 RepID=UPI002147AF36|nr:hypothetical protein [Endozoicomonas sp. ONNA2]
MDNVINHTVLPETVVNKSTQTDCDAPSSGSLGPYEISHVDEVVTFTGCLPDKEISVEKGRVVVTIRPALNVTARDADDNNRSFSIRFQSLPSNQASVNVIRESSDSEDLAPDKCVMLSNDASISGKTVPESHIYQVSSVGNTRRPVLSEISMDSVSSNASLTEGLDTSSALTARSSSLGKQSLSSNCSDNTSFLNFASSDRFRNGQKICKIVEMRRDPHRCKNPVSRVISSSLINYDPGTVPGWYKSEYSQAQFVITEVESFILKSFANYMGWLDANGKGKNIFTGSANVSSNPLRSQFVDWFETDARALECICEVARLLANAESQVDQCFRGSSKTNPISRVNLYQTLSFKKSNKEFIKSKSRSGDLQLLSDCSSAIFFFFSNFVSKLESAIESKKQKAEKAAIARKRADHKVPEKKKGIFDLLKACANYNLAVQLIDREIKRAGLAQQDSERMADEMPNEGSHVVDYTRVEPGDLHVMRQLLVLIENLEKEGLAILSDYQTFIEALPRAVEGKKFEQRVLRMFDNGNGYVSEPLHSMKSTLTAILENNLTNLQD